MKAVLRIALACFSMLGLQTVLNVIGAALLVISVGIGTFSKPGQFSPAGGVAMSAAAFVAFVPAYGGGLALRYLLALNATHLRPYGRERILGGAALAITLLACLITMPILIAHLAELSGARDPLAKAAASTLFAATWASIAANWIFSYAASAHPRTYPLVFLIPIAGTQLARFGHAITPLLPSAFIGLTLTIACWAAFAICVLRTRTIRTLPILYGRDPTGFGNKKGVAPDLSAYDPVSKAVAIRQFLIGAATWWGSALGGAGMLLVVAMIYVVLAFKQDPHATQGLPMIFLGMFSALSGGIAFSLVRRSRLLWLRTGTHRGELFHLAERHGLMSALISIGVLSVALSAWSIAMRPELFGSILLSAVASLTFSVLVFYALLGFTRELNAADVLLGLAVIIALPAHIVMSNPQGVPIHQILTMLAIWAALAPLLRWHAARRWQKLDWRVAKLIFPMPRGRSS